jgi:cbb3-type cytochrome oxidase subunit 3
MAVKDKKKFRGMAAKKGSALPFVKENYYLFGIGLFVILIGYIALAHGPWNSFSSLTLAPILLVIGYCVIIPVAILYRKKQKKQQDETGN